MPTEAHPGKGPKFDYTVDGEPQSTPQHVLTPVLIMNNAGVDPASHYLVQIIGQKQESYQANPNQEIHMHEHMKFITVRVGPPTPVS
jgi:hypothetical protein